MQYIYGGGSAKLEVVRIYLLGTRSSGVPPDLVDPPLFYFWNLVLGPSLGIFPLPRGSQTLGYTNHLYTHLLCQHMIFHLIFHISLPCHSTVCHVVAWTSTWHFFIGPWIDQKNPKMSDMWQPLVIPHHHDDVIMTCFTSYVCHVHCTDVDVIHTDVDVNNTDVDSYPVDWARLTKL
jgi:hypothetical protein